MTSAEERQALDDVRFFLTERSEWAAEHHGTDFTIAGRSVGKTEYLERLTKGIGVIRRLRQEADGAAMVRQRMAPGR